MKQVLAMVSLMSPGWTQRVRVKSAVIVDGHILGGRRQQLGNVLKIAALFNH
tara:strand:- start:568 stop:723 length:156 start_codon:yes stop_codon:yes gene_type:complete